MNTSLSPFLVFYIPVEDNNRASTDMEVYSLNISPIALASRSNKWQFAGGGEETIDFIGYLLHFDCGGS